MPNVNVTCIIYSSYEVSLFRRLNFNPLKTKPIFLYKDSVRTAL
jgi:hypothetical protein